MFCWIYFKMKKKKSFFNEIPKGVEHDLIAFRYHRQILLCIMIFLLYRNFDKGMYGFYQKKKLIITNKQNF